ncbi:hypothetical protein CENSYa_0211 [Cenarchaeum symbiosum A]|uniref:Uncharacterized protein n=1 Tax=Cenarchaeum symbiosum (strain A) TaxID=414004 RepID=A0RU37_CENSY|nr:hypothetical protein CENSYa_0211 [Cenarchaeum symbiosum A]
MDMIFEYIFPNFSEFIASITLIISTATIVGSAVKYFHDKDMEKVMTSRNLYAEMKNGRDTLEDKNALIECNITLDDEGRDSDYYFKKMLLNHDIYDSAIYSGIINSLETKLQQSIQDIFRIVKRRNEYIVQVLYPNSRSTEEERIRNDRMYSKWLNEHEKILKKRIPVVMEELEIYRHIFAKRMWVRLWS